jgi:hypothetical protein
MQRFKKIIFLFIIIIFTLLSINSNIDINKKEIVCIIYKKSKYKTEIANHLEKKLKEKDVIVERDLIRNLNKYDPLDYSAIVILSGIAIFTPNPMVTIYIKKHNYNKNIIYFCSTEYKDAAYGFLDQEKVDVITSASEKNNIDEVVNEILENLNIIINQK